MHLFAKKYSISEKRLLEGATDHHSHILFGVDDGVSRPEESLAILSILEKEGLKSLWLTPHTMEDVPNTTAGLKERFEELKALYHGPIELHLASEYMMDEMFERHLADKDFLFHKEEGSILMETSTTALSHFTASRPVMTARSSIRLLVVQAKPPDISLRRLPQRRTTP